MKIFHLISRTCKQRKVGVDSGNNMIRDMLCKEKVRADFTVRELVETGDCRLLLKYTLQD